MSRKKLTTLCCAMAIFSGVIAQNAPKPAGLVPNERQREWFDREMIAFFHFGINTFEDFVNEGDGRAPAAIFNPTALDCDQWMKILSDAGIPSAILTAKHADGFCLWPSQYTDYGVKNSAWKNGKGDVVREFVDACDKYGIKAGIYLGPHDRHEHLHPQYSTEKYKDYYANQLRELMSDYGTIWETWWDGAGADELTTPLYTEWYNIVHELQPQCVIFGTKNSYPFADVRWMGNESGIAGDPCWSTTDSVAIRDEAAYIPQLEKGVYEGNAYVPAETDVSIRPSWFYHPEEDKDVKTPAKLWDIYCTSVGRNSVLLLNFPPDRRGLIHPVDSASIMTFRKGLDETFSRNLLAGSKVTATNNRGKKFDARYLIDNDPSTYYAGKDGDATSTITFKLPKAETFDCLSISEVIELGHRTSRWSMEYSENGRDWVPIPGVTGKQTIGHKWIERFEPITARWVRLKIEDGRACPAIHSLGLYKQSSLFK
ncbi:MAG: alpha-L-fucosidase [Muribaculaceae bacterium]|nr:alpha-L-fucosidase [Muribaculaceae bacterium]